MLHMCSIHMWHITECTTSLNINVNQIGTSVSIMINKSYCV